MQTADAAPPSADHPIRRALHDEFHARPALMIDRPAGYWHVALMMDASDDWLPPRFLSLLDDQYTTESRHGIVPFEDGRLKWERHTEFLSLTFATATPSDIPPSAFEALYREFPGTRIAAAHVAITEDLGEPIADKLGRHADVALSTVSGGGAYVWTTFAMDGHGYVHLHLANRELGPERLGRAVRRLIEIENYRMMALLGLPASRAANRRIVRFDRQLLSAMDRLRDSDSRDHDLLQTIAQLSSEVMGYIGEVRDRFSATDAYADIVGQRLYELREERVEDYPRLKDVIERRFQPAIRTCQNTYRRLENLTTRVARATTLLSTSVQVQLQDQNAALLESMQRRTESQDRFQRAIEHFSIIAISYYLVSLVAYFLDGAGLFGLATTTKKAAILVLVPLSLLAVWSLLRHIRRVTED